MGLPMWEVPTPFPPRIYLGAYIQDDWRATSNLTLNLGLRWEFIGAPIESNGRFANFVPAQTGLTSDGVSRFYIPQSQVANEPAAFQTLLANNGIVFTPVSGNGLVLGAKTNFGPRLGLAYQITPKLVVRGGYGLFYQGNENHGLSISNYINFPFQVSSSYTAGNSTTPLTSDNSVGALQNGLVNIPLTAAAAASSSKTSLGLYGEPYHAKTSYAQAYHLQFQYQLAANMVAEVSYVGASARHLQAGENSNTVGAILPPSANANTSAFFPSFATNGTFIARAAATNYNALQVNVERRFTGGFSLLANYTYSKCLGDAHDMLDNGIGAYRAPYVPGVGIAADYGFCDIDVRQIAHVSGIYELPFGKNKPFLPSGPGAWLLGGWSANWIFFAQDGQPLTIACTTTNAAGLGCNALKVPGVNPYAGQHNAAQFLNPAAFANAAPATATSASIANLGGRPTQVTGPPFRRLNFSVVRQFPAVRETFFEFRAEVFNLTNTPNFGQPGNLNFINTTTFASISATRDNPSDPRQLQFSLKYYF
jgi:hypothetical protein